MSPLDLALRGGVLPAGISVLGWWLLRTEARRARWSGVALAAGYAAGHLACAGVPRGLPAEAWQWLLPLVPGVALLTAFVAGGGVPARLARAAAGLAAAFCLLPRSSAGPRLGLALGITAYLELLAASVLRGGPGAGRAVVLAAGGSTFALLLSGSLLHFRLTGALAAAAVPLAFRGALPGAALTAGAGLACLWTHGKAYSDLTWDVLALLAAAPLAAGGRLQGWGGTLLAGLLAAAAVGLAAFHSPPLDY